MIEQIPQREDSETGAKAHSAGFGDTLHFSNLL